MLTTVGRCPRVCISVLTIHIPAMEVMVEETFGPVVGIMKVEYLQILVYLG
jgi:acyl-CoA reductase-like NAD-dependent aldehyde dehydrogenase